MLKVHARLTVEDLSQPRVEVVNGSTEECTQRRIDSYDSGDVLRNQEQSVGQAEGKVEVLKISKVSSLIA